MISVESTADTIHVHIPRWDVTGERLEASVAGSDMTDAVADAMAEEMKANWWAHNRHRFIPPASTAEA